VRRVTAADVDAWSRLRLDFIRQSSPPFEWDEAQMERETARWLRARLERDDIAAYLAEVKGAPAGIGAVTIYEVPPSPAVSGTEAYISSMYTEPRFRGRGVARAVLAELLAFARSGGVRGRVWLRATDAGRPLYEAAGFLPRDYFMQLRLTD
jgi:GNAT superfamily N-acetyltransferase